MADRNAGQTPEQINAALLQENALLQAEIQRLRSVVMWSQSLLPREADQAELDRLLDGEQDAG